MLGLNIETVTQGTQLEVKELILECLGEYFTELNLNLNQDLNEITKTYSGPRDLFIVGKINDEIVCSGALYKETDRVARLCRMAVKKEYRRKGLAKKVLIYLEEEAINLGYKNILIETSVGWSKPIQLYKDFNYEITKITDNEVHFHKSL